jgi:hypothetical protein
MRRLVPPRKAQEPQERTAAVQTDEPIAAGYTVLEWTHSVFERHVCRAGVPWDESKGRFGIHPDARPEKGVETGSVWFRCPNCLTRFQLICIKRKG